jgi:acyl-CoA synthetase (AMP-forming)/AMP-acid ligase II
MASVAPTHFANLFDALVATFPDAPCQVHEGRRWTWSETSARAAGVGAGLIALGVERQEKVAVYLYNCPEYIESVWASWSFSLVPVNTNYRYRDAELRNLWDNADAVTVIFHGAFTETIERIRPGVLFIRAWIWVDDGTGRCPDWAIPYERLATVPAEHPPASARSGDDITLLYTGGTTGMPKGVMWRMADYTSILVGPVDAGTGVPVSATLPAPIHVPAPPLMHGVGLHTSLKILSVGGSVITLAGRRFDVVKMLDTIQAYRVTSLAIVGDAFARPMVAALDAEPGRWDISSLRQVVSSGVIWSPITKLGLLAHGQQPDPHRHPRLVRGDGYRFVGCDQSAGSARRALPTHPECEGDH